MQQQQLEKEQKCIHLPVTCWALTVIRSMTFSFLILLRLLVSRLRFILLLKFLLYWNCGTSQQSAITADAAVAAVDVADETRVPLLVATLIALH